MSEISSGVWSSISSVLESTMQVMPKVSQTSVKLRNSPECSFCSSTRALAMRMARFVGRLPFFRDGGSGSVSTSRLLELRRWASCGRCSCNTRIIAGLQDCRIAGQGGQIGSHRHLDCFGGETPGGASLVTVDVVGAFVVAVDFAARLGVGRFHGQPEPGRPRAPLRAYPRLFACLDVE